MTDKNDCLQTPVAKRRKLLPHTPSFGPSRVEIPASPGMKKLGFGTGKFIKELAIFFICYIHVAIPISN